MTRIFIIMGKSATGKDSVFKQLTEITEIKLKTIVGYTTRPIRQGEQNGAEYYFVSEEEMVSLEKQGKIIECRRYKTVHGYWSYFTADDGQIDLNEGNYIVIGTLEGCQKLTDYYGADIVVPIYIEIDDEERILRAIQREKKQSKPNYAEVCRRYLADEEDFSEENIKRSGIKKRYINDNLHLCVNKILEDMKKMM